MPAKKAQVFISYSWKDKAAADRIEEALANDQFLSAKISIWRDVNKVQPGDHISEKILQGLQEADYFVLLVSEPSNSSQWVKREVATAVGLADNKKLTVVPVLLQPVEVPFEFRGLLYINGQNSISDAVNKLLQFLRDDFSKMSVLEPRVMMRKAYSDETDRWRACQDKLRGLERGQLRRHLTDNLGISDIKVLWFDLFERKMEEEVAVQTLALCCVELLERARREDCIPSLISAICQNHKKIAASL